MLRPCAGECCGRVARIALPEMKGNFIYCALLPLFRLCQPKKLVLDIEHRTFRAEKFLIADF
jgi:hypothetical protein